MKPQTGKTYLKITCLLKNLYPGYTEIPENRIIRKNLTLKMGSDTLLYDTV